MVLATESNSTSINNNMSNHVSLNDTLSDDSRLLPGNYTPDQINEIIYHLCQLVQNSNSTEKGYSQDLAILIDIICSNELYENAVETCDIVTELPIESNNYWGPKNFILIVNAGRLGPTWQFIIVRQ